MAVSLATDALEGSIEIPEAMIRGAVILYNKGITDRAHDLLTSAMPLYTLERTDKIHRHAVTAWLLGCIEYVQGHRLEGYSQWKNAHSLFEDLRVQALKEKQIEKANWYRDRLEEMSVYAIQTFEEIYFQWMNQFDTIVLPESLNNFRNILDRQLGADQVMQLRKTLSQYLEDSKNLPGLEENWVCRVDAAFYQYETKDYISALDPAEPGLGRISIQPPGGGCFMAVWADPMVVSFKTEHSSQKLGNQHPYIQRIVNGSRSEKPNRPSYLVRQSRLNGCLPALRIGCC